MEKRTLLALALSFLILFLFQYFYVKQQPIQEKKPVQKTGQVAQETKKNLEIVLPPQKTFVSEEKEIKVETDLYKAIFTSKGATIKYFEIKRYKDEKGRNIVLLKEPGEKPPLSIGRSKELEYSDVNFSVSKDSLILNKDIPTGSISFEYAGTDAIIKRTLLFSNDNYKIEIKDEISNLPEYWITLGSNFGIYSEKEQVHVGPVILKEANRMEFNKNKLNEMKTFKEGLKWIAQEDKYFFSALVPKTQVDEAVIWKYKDSALVAFNTKNMSNNFILYAGPKEYDTLKALNLSLEHIIDFGFFSIVAVPLFWVLKLFYKVLGNYGWAIILITLIIRIPFIPLINKSQKSMKKMQEIQPKMAEIREKYKKDPKRMQQELMELYKKHKVNPVGGCLPILLQIPIFFALYKILLIAIELRGAPFLLWIKDLSAPDTLFGHIPSWFPLIGGFAVGPLPILMGASMVIQQKMTPTSLDPAQNKLMMIMPVIFTFLFLNFASGLVLYWLMNNVFSIIQQFYVNKKLEKEKK